MLHANILDHRTFGYGKDFKGFHHIGATAILIM